MQFIIITLLLGLFWGLTRKIDNYLYLFFFSIFYLPLLLNWTNMYQYQGFIPISLIGLLFFLNIRQLLRRKLFSMITIRLIVIVLSLVFIIIINSKINNYDTIKGLLFFRNFFWAAILFAIIISVGRIKVDLPKILFIIFITQVVLVVIQYFGGSSMSKPFLLVEYEKNGMIQSATSESVINASIEAGNYLLVGSLGKITRLSNFLSLFVTYWTGYVMLKYSKLRIIDWVVIIISISIIVLSGVRASFISAIVGCVLSYFIINNTSKKKILLIITTLFIILLLPELVKIGNVASIEGINYGETFQRSMSIFSILGNMDSLDSTNTYTLGHSLYLLQYLNIESFLFGTGIYTNNPLGYGAGVASFSDCMLIFIIVEYGIIAFLLCIAPYILVIHHVKKFANKEELKWIIVLFFIIVLQTIVDQGMFDMLTSYCFYIICALFIKSKTGNMIAVRKRFVDNFTSNIRI